MWYRILHLNPEPWAVGTVTGGRRISPDLNLRAYQEAVREELEDAELLPHDHRKITFYFWRQQAVWLDVNDRKRQRNQADATNMQKALEDALQGILFENDREIRDIRSVIVAQGPEVEPGILILAQTFNPLGFMNELPHEWIDEVQNGGRPKPSSNEWRGPQNRT